MPPVSKAPGNNINYNYPAKSLKTGQYSFIMSSIMILTAYKPATRVSNWIKCHQHSLILTSVHQSVSHLLPGMSHVMYLCCNAAIPGIPPWNAQIGPHRIQNGTKTAKQDNIPQASFNKKILCCFIHRKQHAEWRVIRIYCSWMAVTDVFL